MDLSRRRRSYYSDEYNLTICPECGIDLINENCTILISAQSETDKGEFMTNMSGSHFCNKCPVVVFDLENIEKAAKLGIRGDNNLQYSIAGIIDLKSIPDSKKHLELGCDQNPLPLIHFLPDLKKRTVILRKKIGRNEPCVCGSLKKYKKCCGK